MSKWGWYAGSAASFGVAVLLSQLRHQDERRFPADLPNLVDQEHGHEVASQAVDEFFEGRELTGRMTWLFYSLGVVLAFRGLLRRPN